MKKAIFSELQSTRRHLDVVEPVCLLKIREPPLVVHIRVADVLKLLQAEGGREGGMKERGREGGREG